MLMVPLSGFIGVFLLSVLLIKSAFQSWLLFCQPIKSACHKFRLWLHLALCQVKDVFWHDRVLKTIDQSIRFISELVQGWMSWGDQYPCVSVPTPPLAFASTQWISAGIVQSFSDKPRLDLCCLIVSKAMTNTPEFGLTFWIWTNAFVWWHIWMKLYFCLFGFPAWVLLIVIEEGFALAQKIKGMTHIFTLGCNILYTSTWSLLRVPFYTYIVIQNHILSAKFLFTLFTETQNEGESNPTKAEQCGQWTRNINGGLFTSPNYPNSYPPNKECVYILEGTAIYL